MSLNYLISLLKPREMIFFDMLEASVENLVSASKLFEQEFSSKESPDQWKKLRYQMKDLEHVGDNITHNIVDRLNRTFITPIDRDDILAIAHALDDVVDCLDGVCERLALYKITTVMPLAIQLAHMIALGGNELTLLIHNLRNMSQLKEINNHIQACMELENQADAVLNIALAEIFEDPKDSIELIKWKELLYLLEEATDRIELVSKVVSSTIMRNA